MEQAIPCKSSFLSFRLSVPTTKGTLYVSSQDIIRMEASSNYTRMYFTNHKPLVIAKVLGQYESLLSAFGFLRTHRSHLVNKNYISFVDDRGKLQMNDLSVVELSRRKKSAVMKLLKAA